MRTISFFVTLAILLCGALPCGAQAAPAETYTWQWLLAQAASGAESITLPGDIVCDSDEGLSASGTLRIDGAGHSITGARIASGTIVFKDTRLLGLHGIDAESGGDALVLVDDGCIAVLMGTTRAEGGRSGPQGEYGGDGVRLLGAGQGIILNSTSSASGGIGRLYGGAGIRVEGCDGNILLADSATITGSLGLVEGGAGVNAPACATITASQQGSMTGGNAQYVAGNGLQSLLCERCDASVTVSAGDMVMAIGGIGQTGGHGMVVERADLDDHIDLALDGSCMLIGGDGETNGAALHARRANIHFSGQPKLFGGRYYMESIATLMLEDCSLYDESEGLLPQPPVQSETYPAGNISSIINTAISQRSERYQPSVIEGGLAEQATEIRLNGLTVERGSTSQAKVNDAGLKIFMYNTTLEKRLQFKQRLMEDGDTGTRLVLIAVVSDEWPTVEASVAALRKLVSLDITQLAYTTVAPTYNERVLDIAALLDAIDAYDAAADTEIPRVLCGTADDAVIFVLPDGTREYQEALMPEIQRALQ